MRHHRLYLVAVWALLPGTACAPRPAAAETYADQRKAMVRQQIAGRGVTQPRVLDAMRRVERHRFVPKERRDEAYDDRPLPIGDGQTISQPYIVAFMTQALGLQPEHRVLEIGTGSGYQAAVLAEIAKEVYSIEIVPQLGERARDLLASLGYKNVHVRVGDGYRGWPEKAPFDAIILTAAPRSIPRPLLEQLRKPGGVLVAPSGPDGEQRLVRVRRTNKGFESKDLLDVRFVPMTGEAQGR